MINYIKTSVKVLTLGLVLLATQTRGQEQVSYTEVHNDPTTYSPLILNFWVSNFDFGTHGIAGYVGLGGDFTLNNAFTFSADIQKDMIGGVLNEGFAKSSSSSIEVGGVFNFVSSIKDGKAKYDWHEPGHNYILTVDCKVLKQTGIRGGIYSYGSPFAFKGLKDALGHDPSYRAWISNNGFYAGIVFTRTRDQTISVTGIYKRQMERRGYFYIDVLFASSLSYADNVGGMDYTGGMHPRVNGVLDPTNVAKLLTGWRFGKMQASKAGWLRGKYGWEIGSRPTFTVNDMGDYYGVIKIAVSIGFLKKKAE